MSDEIMIDVAVEEGTIIDATKPSGTVVKRVNLSSINNGNPNTHHTYVKSRDQIAEDQRANRPTNKTIISPKQQQQTPPRRKTVSIASIAAPDKEDEIEDKVSLEKEILNIDNPNSMFSNYVKEKEEEAVEWIAEKEEERALEEEAKELEIEDEDDTNYSDEDLIEDEEEYDESEVVITNTNIEIEEIDISNINKKNNGDNNMNKKLNNVIEDSIEEEEVEEIIVDEGIDKEDLPTPSEIEEEEFEEEYDNDEEVIENEDETEDSSNEPELRKSENKQEEKKSEPEKPVLYDAPDIDIEEEEDVSSIIIEEEEDESADVDTADEKELAKKLQKLITDRIKPVSKRLDISSFTVLKKPVANVNNVLKESSSRVIKWVLPNQESVILMKEWTGAELEMLRDYTENSRSMDALNRRFKMIYDHIVSPKPVFDVWLKTTPSKDVDHYFFAIYIACFKNANFLPADCSNKQCDETFITDDINIMDMVKFSTQESKDKFTKLYQAEELSSGKGIYSTEIVPISDKVAIAFRDPSIYNAFEVSAVDDKTSRKYSTIIPYMMYIDTLYIIDENNKSLIPVTYKEFVNERNKTFRSKLAKYNSILSTINVDQFGTIQAYVNAIAGIDSGMKYIWPEVTCPHCGTKIEEQEVEAQSLVFTRYQLGTLVTTSLS